MVLRDEHATSNRSSDGPIVIRASSRQECRSYFTVKNAEFRIDGEAGRQRAFLERSLVLGSGAQVFRLGGTTRHGSRSRAAERGRLMAQLRMQRGFFEAFLAAKLKEQRNAQASNQLRLGALQQCATMQRCIGEC